MRKMRLSGARKKCDKKLSNLELQIKKFYKLQEYQLTRSWQEYMKKGNAKIGKVWKDYEDAKATGDEDLIRKTGIAHRKAVEEYTLQNQHYKNMVNETAEQMAHAYDSAVKIINGELPEMYAISYNAVGEAAKSIVKGYSFELMDREVARNLLIGNKEYMNYFKQANIPKSERWNKKLIHSQMSQGIMQGESIDKLANRIYHIVNSNSRSAVLHARTMTTGIENRGRQDGFDKAEQDGIVVDKEWIATGDDRTRDWHAELNGQVISNNEKFENEYGEIAFPGDADAEPENIYNCRCALGGVVVGFKTKDGKINYV